MRNEEVETIKKEHYMSYRDKMLNEIIKHIEDKYICEVTISPAYGSVINVVIKFDWHYVSLDLDEVLKLNNLNKEKLYYRLDYIIEKLLIKTFIRGEKQ